MPASFETMVEMARLPCKNERKKRCNYFANSIFTICLRCVATEELHTVNDMYGSIVDDEFIYALWAHNDINLSLHVCEYLFFCVSLFLFDFT